MTLYLDELSAEAINFELNTILKAHNSPTFKIEESDLSPKQKRLIAHTASKNMLAHLLLLQKMYPIEKKKPVKKLIREEDFYNRYPINEEEFAKNSTAKSEWMQFYRIFERLDKPVRALTADKKMLKELQVLLLSHPNIEDNGLLEAVVKSEIVFSKDKTIHLPPLLFCGPSGCGKTFLAKQLYELFGQTHPIFIALGAGRGASALVGSTPDYRNSENGEILSAAWEALDCETCSNPVIILDEIDKCCTSNKATDANANMLGLLLQLLGDINLQSFRDAFFDVPLIDYQPSFICTCNKLEPIPEPLIDRFGAIIMFRDYTKQELIDIVIPKQYGKYRSTRNKNSLPPQLEEHEREIIYKLCQGKTRLIYTAITLYFSIRISGEGKLLPINEDKMNQLIENLEKKDVKSQIGFCR